MSKVQQLLQYLTGRRTVPNILVDFESIGGSDEVTLLHGEGGLLRQFEDIGLMGPRPGMAAGRRKPGRA